MKSTETKRKISGKVVSNISKECDPPPSAEDRLGRIATAAYYKAEARGFMPGQEMGDWLAAEAELGEGEGP